MTTHYVYSQPSAYSPAFFYRSHPPQNLQKVSKFVKNGIVSQGVPKCYEYRVDSTHTCVIISFEDVFLLFKSEWYRYWNRLISWFFDFVNFYVLGIFMMFRTFLIFPQNFDPLPLWLNSIIHHGQNSKKRGFQWFSCFVEFCPWRMYEFMHQEP